MEPETYYILQNREDTWRFIRQHPMWYRYLTRDPSRITELEVEEKQFYGRTIPQRLEKTQQNMQLVKLLMQMAGNWND